jgi:hypothetical protein
VGTSSHCITEGSSCCQDTKSSFRLPEDPSKPVILGKTFLTLFMQRKISYLAL